MFFSYKQRQRGGKEQGVSENKKRDAMPRFICKDGSPSSQPRKAKGLTASGSQDAHMWCD